MAHIIIKKAPGEYNNSDAFNKTIGYISNHNSIIIGGYGFIPLTADNAIETFNNLDDSMYKIYPIERKLWHIIFSFDNTFSYDTVYHLSTNFCKYLSQNGFYSFYGIHHPDSNFNLREYHVHFCIPTFPSCIYYPWNPKFVLSLLENYIQKMRSDYENYQKTLNCSGITSSKSSLTIRKVGFNYAGII